MERVEVGGKGSHDESNLTAEKERESVESASFLCQYRHAFVSFRKALAMQTGILSGWKDIANYMGKGVRTVQRYERELGLPVRRPAGKPRGSVLSTMRELDAWTSSHPQPGLESQRAKAEAGGAQVTSLRAGISEMRKLRAQMTRLRGQLHHEREDLVGKVRGLPHAKRKKQA